MERILNAAYNNPSSPSYLAGISAVYREAKKRYSKLTFQNVKDFLSRQNAYTLHKPIRKRFPRNRVVGAGIDTDWQSDLIDVLPLKRYNEGYSYIVVMIDVFSRYAWAIPVKNKRADTVLEDFKQVLKSGRKPYRLVTDGGSEYRGCFKGFCKQNDIVHFVATSPDVKACNAERYIRTLKTRLWRHFTKAKTFTYLDVLPKLVAAINNTECRVTRHAPADVTMDNEQEVRAIINDERPPKPPMFIYKLDEPVRITKEKCKLGKGYQPSFTEEVFTVAQRLNRHPPVYRLKDKDGTVISGIFYSAELARVSQMHKKARRPPRRR